MRKNDEKTKLFPLLTLMLLLTSFSMAQDLPKWIGELPRPLNDTYTYIRAHGRGDNYEKAKEDALQDLRRQVQEAHGDATEVVEIEGETYYKTINGQKNKIQKKEVAEWVSKTGKEFWFLYQIQTNANIKPIFTEFYSSSFKPWHPIIPGLGQFKKGYDGVGATFIALQTATIGCAGYCYIKEQEQLKTMHQTEVGLNDFLKAKKAYDQWYLYRTLSIIGASVIYGTNIIVAYSLPSKQERFLSFYPDVIQAEGNLALGATITYKF